MKREPVGIQLVEAKVISSEALAQALTIQRDQGGRLGSILVRMGVLSEAVLLEFLSQHYGVPRVNLSTCQIDEDLQRFIPSDLAHQYLVLPVGKTSSRLTLAMVDPTNTSLLDEIRLRTGLQIFPMVATESDLQAAINMRYGPSPDVALAAVPLIRERTPLEIRSSTIESQSPPHPQKDFREGVHTRTSSFGITNVPGENRKHKIGGGDEVSPVDVVNTLLRQAIEMEASDLHIEPLEKMVRIRFRLDGVLRPIHNLPKDLHQPLVARLKILAHLDIAERRLPQDGRMKVDVFPNVDIRVAILPCLYGEKVVLRLLSQSGLALHLSSLGLEPGALEDLTTALDNPYGMILVTGPTGSGKTTTLYSALQYLNTAKNNIVTIEDPVEFQIPGINQMQIHEDIGLTFSTGLRAFLRQDPDVIMVGEIRDRETAQIAIQASLTGHRVLSTLHTMNAPGAITRLLEMGIEPFLVSSAVSLILAQRLVRKICSECAEPDPNASKRLLAMKSIGRPETSSTILKGKGCSHCHQTGFRGRFGLFETLPIVGDLHEHILSRASTNELKGRAVKNGFRTLRQAGLRAVHEGLTTLEEVFNETREDSGAILSIMNG